MKFFVAFLAVCSLAAAGPVHKPNDATNAELEAIIAAIQSPNTDPGTAALLEQQLQDILDSLKPEYEPIVVGPAVIDEYEPIIVAPAIVDDFEQISVGPAIVEDFDQISVGPAIVDESVVGPAAVQEAPTPLVQIIINVAGYGVSASPVVVEESPASIDRPTPVQTPEVIVPEPAIVPEPVIVVPEVIVPEPVIVAPEVKPEPAIVPEPVIVVPELNPQPAIVPEELN